MAARVASQLSPALAAAWLEWLFFTPRRGAPPAREEAWQADARRSMLEVSSTCTVPVYQWGDAGPRVVLVHGWAGRGLQLGAWVSALLDAGFQVVTFDAPGHGGATGPRRTTIPEMASALERVVSEVGPVHGVVAHSLGSASVSRAIADGLPVERIVFVAPPADPGRFLHQAARFLGFGRQISRAVQTKVQIRVGTTFDELRTARLAESMTVPLLVLHDRTDRVVPFDDGAAVAEAWPGAGLVATEGLGHQRILRDVSVVERGVAFLAAGQDRRDVTR